MNAPSTTQPHLQQSGLARAVRAAEKLEAPQNNERQEHLDGKRKEHISPNQALQLVKELKEITGESLPIIPTSKGGKVQVVSFPDGKFFLYHDSTSGIENKSFGGEPIEYNFNSKGVYKNARTSPLSYSQSKSYAETSQELLGEIKAYIASSKKKSN